MDSINEFFSMGGYAFYVWSSYGLTILVLTINVILPNIREQTLLKELARKKLRNQHDSFYPKT